MRARHLFLLIILFVSMVIVGIPWLLVRPGVPAETGTPAPGAPAPGAPVPARALDRLDVPVNVFDNESKRLLTLPLEDYVAGVVAAEMPASFAPEALKAQAAVARTYAVVRMRLFGGRGCPRHPAADVCTDPAEGQAWASKETLKRRWGSLRFPSYWRKVNEAVDGTRGLIVVYANRPIDAVFHAASGGRTEDAEAVWGRAVPYLRSVPSPGERAERYDGVRATFSLAELADRTRVPLSEIRALRGEGKPVVSVLSRTPSGRVAQVRIGRAHLTGGEVREALGLNSTFFEWRLSGDRIEVVTKGYGHGVGMSQYGADTLARGGADFRAILRHYYRGVQVRPLFTE